MSVNVRPYRNGGWMVDIHSAVKRDRGIESDEWSRHSKSAAQRWGQNRERYLLPTWTSPNREGGADTRRIRTAISSTDTRVRIVRSQAGSRRKRRSFACTWSLCLARKLNAITNEDVQHLKHRLASKAREDRQQRVDSAERDAEDRRGLGRHRAAALHDSVVADTNTDASPTTSKSTNGWHGRRTGRTGTYLLVLLGGEAGLRLGEMMALEWTDVDLRKRQLCVQRSDWKGQVTTTKGGGCDMSR